jgi:hypothetical protein
MDQDNEFLHAFSGKRAPCAIAWWEKSVEYLFITKAVRKGWFKLLLPLAGVPEKRYGDLVLQANDASFYLIEFKRYEDSWKDEIEKFHRNAESNKEGDLLVAYIAALTFLQKYDAHKSHYIIYGSLDESAFKAGPDGNLDNALLQLRKTLYCDPLKSTEFNGSAPSIGVTREKFAEYLNVLQKLRDDEEEESGGGGSGAVSYVVAVTADQTITLSLKEFKTALTPQKKRNLGLGNG